MFRKFNCEKNAKNVYRNIPNFQCSFHLNTSNCVTFMGRKKYSINSIFKSISSMFGDGLKNCERTEQKKMRKTYIIKENVRNFQYSFHNAPTAWT